MQDWPPPPPCPIFYRGIRRYPHLSPSEQHSFPASVGIPGRDRHWQPQWPLEKSLCCCYLFLCCSQTRCLLSHVSQQSFLSSFPGICPPGQLSVAGGPMPLGHSLPAFNLLLTPKALSPWPSEALQSQLQGNPDSSSN